jgi:hypothetical protein
MRHFIGGGACERAGSPQRISDQDQPERLIKDHEDHYGEPSQRINQSEERQYRVRRRPDALGHGPDMVPRALMINDSLPRFRAHKNEHQEIEHSQQVNVYRANGFVFRIIRREDVFEEPHTREFTCGVGKMFGL